MAACISGCGVCTECRAACDARCTAFSTHTTADVFVCHTKGAEIEPATCSKQIHWLILRSKHTRAGAFMPMNVHITVFCLVTPCSLEDS